MQDFRLQDGFEELEPSYSRHPAHAFRLSARDLARFGELYRLRGTWDGAELLPASWIEESTRPRTDLGRGRGYGHLWWTYAAGSMPGTPALDRHDCFAAIGTGGQLVLVVPGAELVFVHRGDTDNEREVPGSVVWSLAERVLAARTGEARAEPELSALRTEPFSAPGEARPDRAPLALAPERLAGLPGEYTFERGGPGGRGFHVRVFGHEGRLFAHRSFDGEEDELFALTDTRFFMWLGSFEVEFVRDDTGRAGSVRLITSQGTLEGRRSEPR